MKELVLECIRTDPGATKLWISFRCGLTLGQVAKAVGELKREGKIKNEGEGVVGHYIVSP